MSERTRLQVWFKDALDDPDWVRWKQEDKFRPGMPDFVAKHKPSGLVWMVELKWSKAKTRVSATFSPEQCRHLIDWGPGAIALIGAESSNRVYAVAHPKLFRPLLSIMDDDLACLPGVEHCRAQKSEVGAWLRSLLSGPFGRP